MRMPVRNGTDLFVGQKALFSALVNEGADMLAIRKVIGAGIGVCRVPLLEQCLVLTEYGPDEDLELLNEETASAGH